MRITRRRMALGASALGLASLGGYAGYRHSRFRKAVEAYIYGYPLVTMEMTRRVMTNVSKPDRLHAPMGQFVRARRYPDATFRDAPAPNADTLYVSGWLDLSPEPWLMFLPDMGDRYYLFPILDAWTNVFGAPGKRTVGGGPQVCAIVGPGWRGNLPEGVAVYHSPTNLVWILGRIYCTGTAEDYAEVHRIQDQCRLQPLSAGRTDYKPGVGPVDPNIDMRTGVRKQVNQLPVAEFFQLLADLLVRNPPGAADAAMLAKLAEIGVVPGKPVDKDRLNFPFADLAPRVGFARTMAHFRLSKSDLVRENGWAWTLKAGAFGTNYTFRALITAIGLGANRADDAIYGVSTKDAGGSDYHGDNRYRIRFEKGQEPPARGFWSLTLYGEDFYFVANSINRFAISARDNLKRNPDGSVDIFIQHEPPAGWESNWLPAPKGPFQLMWRMYWPSRTPPSILDGTWSMSAVERQT